MVQLRQFGKVTLQRALDDKTRKLDEKTSEVTNLVKWIQETHAELLQGQQETQLHRQKTQSYQDEVRRMLGDIKVLVKDRVAKPTNQRTKGTDEKFILVKLYAGDGFPPDTPDNRKFMWCMIRCQSRHVKAKLAKLQRKYPQMQQSRSWDVNSSVEFANRVKEKLERRGAYIKGESWNLFNTSVPRSREWMERVVNEVVRELKNVNNRRYN